MTQAINFGALPEKHSAVENAEVVIIPVPYDRTSTWMKGADNGPAAIIEASANMELYDIETDSEVYQKGIFTDKPIECEGPPEEMIDVVAAKVTHYIEKGKFIVVIGGEHSVSIGSIKAQAENNKNFTVLQLDAHLDLRDEYNSSRYNHACVMARVRELVPIVQVGIRSMDSSEKKFMKSENVFFAEDIYKNRRWFTKAISRLTDKVYITIDLDVLDPSIMPSTGTPEPGGLLWYDCIAFLKKVFDKRNVVGFDIMELCPNDNNKAPDFLAAKLIYKLLSYK
ncbi:MAG: agmatinase, partial [Sedimentisphaerales bacterium]|nr:agmatinase [Sedimentisphaerales bacterium]